MMAQPGLLGADARNKCRVGRFGELGRIEGLIRVAIVIAVISGTMAPSIVLAQEIGREPFSSKVGPYAINVWTYPSSLTIGRTLFVVNVVDAVTGERVPDASVRILTRHEKTGVEGRAIAVNTTDVRERYEVLLDLTPGTWNIDVEVTSSLGEASIQAPPVTIPRLAKVSSGTFVFIGVTAVLVFGSFYVWWSANRAQQRNSAIRSEEGQGEEAGPGD